MYTLTQPESVPSAAVESHSKTRFGIVYLCLSQLFSMAKTQKNQAPMIKAPAKNEHFDAATMKERVEMPLQKLFLYTAVKPIFPVNNHRCGHVPSRR